jgi:ribosome-binding protein aMBF1 (putative translation factor)
MIALKSTAKQRKTPYLGDYMGSPIPLPVERALARLGQSISLARRRRHMSQQMLAERIGASVNTVRRMEDGFAGTALQHIARALHVFGELDQLNALLDTAQDGVGLALMDEQLPQRVRARRPAPGSGAF